MATPQPGEALQGLPVILANEPILGAGSNSVGFTKLDQSPVSQNRSASFFWNAAVVAAGAQSADYQNSGTTWGKIRVFVKSLVANTFNVQFSNDGGATWYTYTQDNAGTPFIIATTATQLTSCRDITMSPGDHMRLVVITADTVTAGYEVFAG